MTVATVVETKVSLVAVMRPSMVCEAPVSLGGYSRGGKARGDNQGVDPDMGCEEGNAPSGVINQDNGSRHLSLRSSAKARDFIIDSLHARWKRQASAARSRVTHIKVKAGDGPESNGRGAQFLKRMLEFADHIGKSIRLLCYPPHYSKYNPAERCWRILGRHWNGAKLADSQRMWEWAKRLAWKGAHPVVELSGTVYGKGVTVAKDGMQAVESRLERNPLVATKWDILIRPACTV